MLFRDLLHKKVGTGRSERTAQHQNAGRGKSETQTCNHPVPQCRYILVAVKSSSVCLLPSPLAVHHILFPQCHKSLPCYDVSPEILHVYRMSQDSGQQLSVGKRFYVASNPAVKQITLPVIDSRQIVIIFQR